MASQPRVSVVMPVLNREAFLPSALDSILAQTFAEWELVVSDGGSSDATQAILDRYASRDARIRWFCHPGLNIPAARNALLAEMRGDYMAVLDSDDLALPDRLARQVAFLESRPELVGIGANLQCIDDAGNPVESGRYPVRLTNPVELRQRLRAGWGCFTHTSMMIRRTAMGAVGGYRPLFRHAEDDDLFLRLVEQGDLANLPDILVCYRCSEENRIRTGRPLHRAVALASAHLRLTGRPDLVDGRREAVDYAFLSEMLDVLGPASLPVRLFWIGMLQFYREEMPERLFEAWCHVSALPFREDMASEIRRHWDNLRSGFPEMHRNVRAEIDRAAPSECIGKWLRRDDVLSPVTSSPSSSAPLGIRSR